MLWRAWSDVRHVLLFDCPSTSQLHPPALAMDSPQKFVTASACMSMVAMSSSSFLFLQRVVALYSEEKWVQRCFCILWVLLSLSEIVIVLPLGGNTTQVPGTSFFKDDNIQAWVSLNIWFVLFFDTAVLLAVSYKMARSFSTMSRESGRVSWFNFLSGKTLPRLSRLIFRGGQQYYLQVFKLCSLKPH